MRETIRVYFLNVLCLLLITPMAYAQDSALYYASFRCPKKTCLSVENKNKTSIEKNKLNTRQYSKGQTLKTILQPTDRARKATRAAFLLVLKAIVHR